MTDSSTTTDSEDERQSQGDARAKRAREDDMDVALLHRGGCYEVDSASGNIYEVDLLDETCTCPDHQNPETPTPCKHVQRVQFELDAGRIPRPDARLPETALLENSLDDESGVPLVATFRIRIREREERIATLHARFRHPSLSVMSPIVRGIRLSKSAVTALTSRVSWSLRVVDTSSSWGNFSRVAVDSPTLRGRAGCSPGRFGIKLPSHTQTTRFRPAFWMGEGIFSGGSRISNRWSGMVPNSILENIM